MASQFDRHPRPSPKAESPFDRFDYFLALGFFCA